MERDARLLRYKRILAAFDGSPEAAEALRRAIRLAKVTEGEVTAFSVDEHVPRYARGFGKVEELNELKAAYLAELNMQARAIAAECGSAIDIETVTGRAAESILGFAGDQKIDLIVVGHSRHSRVWGTVVGNTAAEVVDGAPCDVLIVR